MKFFVVSLLAIATIFGQSLAAHSHGVHKEAVPDFRKPCQCPPDNCPVGLLTQKAVSVESIALPVVALTFIALRMPTGSSASMLPEDKGWMCRAASEGE